MKRKFEGAYASTAMVRFVVGDLLPDPRWEGPRGARNGRAWSFVQDDGLLKFFFDPPVTRGEVKDVLRRMGAKSIGGKHREGRISVGTVPLLTDTSKMGAYSFCIDAGPPAFHGTCPASVDGFMFHDGARSLVNPTTGKEIKLPPGHPSREFICSSCYAMKGRYGSPNRAIGGVWRTLWTKQAVKDGRFVPTMQAAIQAGRWVAAHKTHHAKTDAMRAEACHPDFFRIHDSGDFYSPQYFAQWVQIVRSFPDMAFWAPTRIWANPKLLAGCKRLVPKLPPNLTLRPSSLFFDQPAPELDWFSPGSTSVDMLYKRTREGVEVHGASIDQADLWMCPAYIPVAMGGGALPSLQRNRQTHGVIRPGEIVGVEDPGAKAAVYPAVLDEDGQFVIDEETGRPLRADSSTPPGMVGMAQAFAPSGSCEIARGTDGRQPCRACWNRPRVDGGLPVAYAKH